MRTLTVAVLAFVLAACDPGSTLPEPSDHVGTYTLRTVDGAPVPAVVFQEGVRRIELVSGSVAFHEDLRAENEYTYRITDANGVRTPQTDDAGTYTVSGSKLLVTWDGGIAESYERRDSTVAVFDGTLNLVFHK
jgi:hypothetical protein